MQITPFIPSASLSLFPFLIANGFISLMLDLRISKLKIPAHFPYLRTNVGLAGLRAF